MRPDFVKSGREMPGRAEPGGCRITFHRYAKVPKGAGDGQDEGAEAMQKGLSLTVAGRCSAWTNIVKYAETLVLQEDFSCIVVHKAGL